MVKKIFENEMFDNEENLCNYFYYNKYKNYHDIWGLQYINYLLFFEF